MSESLPEVWLRGPVEGVPATLQPVAHALLQAREEFPTILRDFPEEMLWTRPGGVAPIGFHLRHVTGVVDRLFTYARGEALSPDQRQCLAEEATPPEPPVALTDLLEAFDRQVDRALEQLRAIDEAVVLEPRAVGRKLLPSTVLGLLFHAAEHVQRHLGQTLVTARILRETRR